MILNLFNFLLLFITYILFKTKIGIHTKYEYKNRFDNKFYTLTLKWNRWYPNLESTVKVFVGAHDRSAQRYTIKQIIMVYLFLSL